MPLLITIANFPIELRFKIYWKNNTKEGLNPKKNQKTTVNRMELYVDLDLPMKEDYSKFIKALIGSDKKRADNNL